MHPNYEKMYFLSKVHSAAASNDRQHKHFFINITSHNREIIIVAVTFSRNADNQKFHDTHTKASAPKPKISDMKEKKKQCKKCSLGRHSCADSSETHPNQKLPGGNYTPPKMGGRQKEREICNHDLEGCPVYVGQVVRQIGSNSLQILLQLIWGETWINLDMYIAILELHCTVLSILLVMDNL